MEPPPPVSPHLGRPSRTTVLARTPTQALTDLSEVVEVARALGRGHGFVASQGLEAGALEGLLVQPSMRRRRLAPQRRRLFLVPAAEHTPEGGGGGGV